MQLLLCHKARKGCFKGKVIYDIHTAVAGTCVYGMFALVHLRNTYCIYGDGDVSALDFILCCCICMHIVITGMALWTCIFVFCFDFWVLLCFDFCPFLFKDIIYFLTMMIVPIKSLASFSFFFPFFGIQPFSWLLSRLFTSFLWHRSILS